MDEKTKARLKEVFDIYPYLEEIVIPTLNEYPIILEGYLVTRKECNYYKLCNIEEAAICSFYARIFIPENYDTVGIEVYDLHNQIDVQWIIQNHYKHAHFNKVDSQNGLLLCTHFPMDVVGRDNPILEIINSAHYLYINFRNLYNGNKFNMEEYSHGLKGLHEFMSERRRNNEKQ